MVRNEIAIYSPIQELAMELATKAVNPVDQSKINVTDLYNHEKDVILKSNNKWSANITGDTTSGKSTIGILEAIDLTDRMIRLKQTKRPFTIKNIARNQYDFSRFFRDDENTRCTLMTDEFDALDDTGENATTEIKARASLVDMHAQRYIHTIFCSPRYVMDLNSKYHLDIINRDDTTKKTYALLSFSMNLFEYTKIPIGYVEFYPGDLIKEWLKIRDLFLNHEYRQKNLKRINKLRETDLYINYQCRKHEQLALLTKYKIQKKRDLEYAKCTKEIGDMYKSYALLGMKYKGRIPQAVESWYNKNGMMMSLIGKDQEIRRIQSHLEIYDSKYEALAEIRKYKKIVIENPTPENKERLQLAVDALDKTCKEIAEKEEWLDKMIEIKKEWDKL